MDQEHVYFMVQSVAIFCIIFNQMHQYQYPLVLLFFFVCYSFCVFIHFTTFYSVSIQFLFCFYSVSILFLFCYDWYFKFYEVYLISYHKQTAQFFVINSIWYIKVRIIFLFLVFRNKKPFLVQKEFTNLKNDFLLALF